VWVNTGRASYGRRGYDAPTPTCRQAQITGELCAALSDEWSEILAGRDIPKPNQHGGLHGGWPAHSELAPACSVGCRQCVVAGDKVQLPYVYQGPMWSNADEVKGTGPLLLPTRRWVMRRSMPLPQQMFALQ